MLLVERPTPRLPAPPRLAFRAGVARCAWSGLVIHALTGCGAPSASAPVEAPPPAEPDLPRLSGLFQTGPGCEISGAARLPDGRIVLADNEVDDRIAIVGLGADRRVDASTAKWVDLGVEVGDIEALASDGATLLVVGSFSRNKGGLVKPKRSRVARVMPVDGAFLNVQLADLPDDAEDDRAVPRAALTTPACLARFAPNTAGATHLCDQISAAEAHGAEGALNVEGASMVDDRLWLGLRAPIAKGPTLVRVSALEDDGPHFDAVAYIELPERKGRYGVRAMEAAADRLVVVFGPEDEASTQDFLLGTVPFVSLQPGATIVPERVVAVPNGVEAALVDGGDLLLFTDGKQGKSDGQACAKAPAQIRIPVP